MAKTESSGALACATGAGCFAEGLGSPSIAKAAHSRNGCGDDHREASDLYRGELLRSPCGRWRVAECRNGLQWIIQRLARSGGPDTARWEGVSFCQTQAALSRLWRLYSGDDGIGLIVLPEHISGGRP